VVGAGGPSDAWNRPRCSPSTRCPHHNPKVRRVGFALDDPYVEQVWAGVIGPSAAAGPSARARTGRGRPERARPVPRPGPVGRAQRAHLEDHRTPRRLRHGPLAPRRRARCAHRGGATQRPPARTGAEWSRHVHDRPLGTHLDRLALAHTDRTLDPDRSVDTARLDHLQHRRPPSPAASASNHDPPPVPRRRPVLIPRGSPTVVPTHRPSAHTLAGAPAGHLPTVPRASRGGVHHHPAGRRRPGVGPDRRRRCLVAGTPTTAVDAAAKSHLRPRSRPQIAA
jgi:hypothetical protein